MPDSLMLIASFVSGGVLGLLNYRLFLKSVEGVSPEQDLGGVRKQVVKAGVFRHLFVFLAGICLIRGASFAPIHLCGGLLLVTYLCRFRSWQSQR